MAKILVVDDQKDARHLLVTLLAYGGHQLFEAADGEEALEAIRRTRPDLVVADVLMPRMDGPELVQLLRAEKDEEIAATPIIFCTAFDAAAGLRERASNLGVQVIIPKPIEPKAILKSVNATLALNAALSPLHAPQQQALVLIVDDIEANLLLARSILEPFGYRLVTATTIREGMALAREHRPDLILSDVNLKNESGFYFINLVKSEPALSEIPFIFLSSSSYSTLSQTNPEAQKADRFILRPIEPEILLTIVKSCLANRTSA